MHSYLSLTTHRLQLFAKESESAHTAIALSLMLWKRFLLKESHQEVSDKAGDTHLAVLTPFAEDGLSLRSRRFLNWELEQPDSVFLALARTN
jgi:hypothetical protein